MMRGRGYTLINIAGLTIGMACSLVIFLYIHYQFSFDNYHPQVERIFRLVMIHSNPEINKKSNSALVPLQLAPAIKGKVPGIESIARVICPTYPVKGTRNMDYDDQIIIVDPEIFSILYIPFLEGSLSKGIPKDFLSELLQSPGNRRNSFPDIFETLFYPNKNGQRVLESGSALLSARSAEKYLGSTDIQGEKLYVNPGEGQWREYSVDGVVRNPPGNTHMQYSLILPISSFEFDSLYPWSYSICYTYLKLAPGVDAHMITRQLDSFLHQLPQIGGKKGTDPNHMKEVVLQPVREIHLYSRLQDECLPVRSTNEIRIYFLIGFLILLMAGLNFINLSTARFSCRIKSTAISKVVGASRCQSIIQFLWESLIYCFLAASLALVCVELGFPAISQWLEIPIRFNLLTLPQTMIALIAGVVVVGIANGIYPALVLSSIPAASDSRYLFPLFPSTMQTGKRRHLPLRKILVSGQFIVAVIILFGMSVVHRQLVYMENHPLGFNDKQKLVLVADTNTWFTEKYREAKKAFTAIPSVRLSSASSEVPGNVTYVTSFSRDGKNAIGDIYWLSIDPDFIPMFDIKMLAGENFTWKMAWAQEGEPYCIINESTAKGLGFRKPQEALGQKVTIVGIRISQALIIGVTGDFFFQGLQEPVKPLLFYFFPHQFCYITLTFDSRRMAEVLAAVREKWREIFPQQPFKYFFVDDQFHQQYRQEEKIGRMAVIASVLGIFIAGLGLFSLVSYLVERRSKEIGIRRILGASSWQVIYLLSGEFLQSLILAVIIGWPIAFLILGRWLQGFAQRVSIGLYPFAFSAFVPLVVAFLATGYRVYSSTVIDPVKALRYE